MASMHAFWSLREGILTSQLRFQFAGTCEIVPVSHARALLLSNFCVQAASDARARHLLEFLGGTF